MFVYAQPGANMPAAKAVFQQGKRDQEILQWISESFMQVCDFKVIGSGVDNRYARFRHITQQCGQCGDSRVTAAYNNNSKLFMSGYIKWQKRHDSLLQKCMSFCNYVRYGVAVRWIMFLPECPSYPHALPYTISTNPCFFRGIVSDFQFSKAHFQNEAISPSISS